MPGARVAMTSGPPPIAQEPQKGGYISPADFEFRIVRMLKMEDPKLVEAFRVLAVSPAVINRISAWTQDDKVQNKFLHRLVLGNKIEAIRLAAKLGLDLNVKRASDGFTPLHLAACEKKQRLVSLLIDLGADPNIRNSSGESAHDIIAVGHQFPKIRQSIPRPDEAAERSPPRIQFEFAPILVGGVNSDEKRSQRLAACNDTLIACEKSGQWHKALGYFDEMSKLGVAGDITTYNTTISCCLIGGQWEYAIRLFDEMGRKGVVQDATAYHSTISACEKSGKWETALQLFEQMGNSGLERDVHTYNETISACKKGAQWERALELMEDMEAKGVVPDANTFKEAICACERAGQWRNAVRLFHDMASKGFERDATTYGATISACRKGGQWDRALRLFSDMQTKGLTKETNKYSEALSACGNYLCGRVLSTS